MNNPFRNIFEVATEMFNVAAGMAEDEANAPDYDPVVLHASLDMAKACKKLMLTAKKMAEEDEAQCRIP